MLQITGLKVRVENRVVLESVDLNLKAGESYVLFGPNGSGKTTLVNAIMGIPPYEVLSGRIVFLGEDITKRDTYERAMLGLFLGFQSPPEITGVKLGDLLKLCLGKDSEADFNDDEMALIEDFRLEDFLNRDVNVGFSGGERKRAEVIQMMFIKPKLLLLDEPDSGVDVESLALVAGQIQRYVENTGSSALIVTHKGDILEHIKAKYACILLDGRTHCYQNPKRVYEDIKRNGYAGCVNCQERLKEGCQIE